MQKEKIYSRLSKLCSVREYCKAEIARKVELLKGDDAIDTQAIISQLCKDNYIDENRYAAAFARDKSALQGWGAAKIRNALARKGLESDAIAYGLEQIDTEKAQARMEGVLAAKLRSIKGEGEEVLAKLLRFGLSRGYSSNQIKAFYDNVRRG